MKKEKKRTGDDEANSKKSNMVMIVNSCLGLGFFNVKL